MPVSLCIHAHIQPTPTLGPTPTHALQPTATPTVEPSPTVVQLPITVAADQVYGNRIARVDDPSGNHWSIASRVEDVNMDEVMKRMAAMGEIWLRFPGPQKTRAQGTHPPLTYRHCYTRRH